MLISPLFHIDSWHIFISSLLLAYYFSYYFDIIIAGFSLITMADAIITAAIDIDIDIGHYMILLLIFWYCHFQLHTLLRCLCHATPLLLRYLLTASLFSLITDIDVRLPLLMFH